MNRGDVIKNLDWVTVFLFLILVGIGWLNIYSAGYTDGQSFSIDLSQRYGKQIIWICASIVLIVMILSVNSRFFEFFAYAIYGLVLFLLILVLIIGKEVNASKSWFILGNLQIQPSEFAKPAVALALARFLSTYNLNIKSFYALAVSGIIIIAPATLILLQPDTGSALVFFTFILVLYRVGFSWIILLAAFFVILLFFLVLMLPEIVVLSMIIGTGIVIFFLVSRNIKYTLTSLLTYLVFFGVIMGISEVSGLKLDFYIIGLFALIPSLPAYLVFIYFRRIKRAFIILAGVAIAVLYTFTVDYGFDNLLNEYQQHRVNIMLGITSDPLGAGYNVNQSKIAIGSGGLTGKGFLQGTQTKLSFVPEQSTDFIFCTVGEEWGFLGTFTVLGLFTFLLIRLIMLAERQRIAFSRIYGYGVFSVLFIHIIVNMAMTIGLFPVIGIPLPFFSYGGSSLWAFTILLYVFLRLDASRKEYIV